MTIAVDALIIGITGSFGSGCSTLSEALRDKGFERVSLSDFVREKWLVDNPGKSVDDGTRSELQNIGNKLRADNGNTYLAEKALTPIAEKSEICEKIVIDSIKHIDEASFFRMRYHNFFLINVDTSLNHRWERLKSRYESKSQNLLQFQSEDTRDAYQDLNYGQKVQLCVDDADIAIGNDVYYEPRHAQISKLMDKVEPFIRLILGQDLRAPSPNESMMSLAYSIALRSSCYKRQVGAVIVDDIGRILATECNENPLVLGSCQDVYGECYRDIFKRRVLEEIENIESCPSCQEKLKDNISSELKCKKCDCDLDRHFIRDRALSRCTALHAEESAILNAKMRMEGCTIYTTTFPCFLCALKIIASGIKTVVYCESYPDSDSESLFNTVSSNGHQIKIEKFEGVKARAYIRLFSLWRGQTEELIRRKKGE